MEEGIKEKLDKLIEINTKQLEQKQTKKWKMPGVGKLNKKQIKKGFVTYFIIRANRRLDIVKVPIDEGVTMVDGIPRLATTDHVLFDAKGAPIVIQPEWSVKPFSPEDNYEQTVREENSAAGAKLLMNKMEKEALDLTKKKGLGGGNWIVYIIIAIVAILGIAYLFGVKFW